MDGGDRRNYWVANREATQTTHSTKTQFVISTTEIVRLEAQLYTQRRAAMGSQLVAEQMYLAPASLARDLPALS